MSKEAKMRYAVAAFVAVALIIGACAAQHQDTREVWYRCYNFVSPGGEPLGPEDVVLVDVFTRLEGEFVEWVKVADDLVWADVTLPFYWPGEKPYDPWLLPDDGTAQRIRFDVLATIGGEAFSYSCVTEYRAWGIISFECGEQE